MTSKTLTCDACACAVDVLGWSRHLKLKTHTLKQEAFDKDQVSSKRVRHAERRVELKDKTEDEIQSILEEEDRILDEAYEAKLEEKLQIEADAIERKKQEDKLRKDDIHKKVLAENALKKKKILIEEARKIVAEREMILRQLLKDGVSPTDEAWFPLKQLDKNNIYVTNFAETVSNVLWGDSWNYVSAFRNMRIDYECTTHVPVYLPSNY